MTKSARSPYLPDAGDLIWLTFDPRVGHEQSGRRPALVISPRLFTERTGLAIACPITSKIKGLPFEVLVSGTKIKGAILPIQVRSVDVKARKTEFIEPVSPRTLKTVRQYLALMVET